jgi:hypothetical protein
MISQALINVAQSIALVSIYMYCTHLQRRLMALESKK